MRGLPEGLASFSTSQSTDKNWHTLGAWGLLRTKKGAGWLTTDPENPRDNKQTNTAQQLLPPGRKGRLVVVSNISVFCGTACGAGFLSSLT